MKTVSERSIRVYDSARRGLECARTEKEQADGRAMSCRGSTAMKSKYLHEEGQSKEQATGSRAAEGKRGARGIGMMMKVRWCGGDVGGGGGGGGGSLLVHSHTCHAAGGLFDRSLYGTKGWGDGDDGDDDRGSLPEGPIKGPITAPRASKQAAAPRPVPVSAGGQWWRCKVKVKLKLKAKVIRHTTT